MEENKETIKTDPAEFRERAEKLINKRCFINQGFKIGEYCRAVEFKVERHGFMHCYYTLMGTNKPLELYGYGEISNEMLYVNSFYAIGGNTGYVIIPVKDCFIRMIPYMDFLEICAGFEKDIEKRNSEEGKKEEEEKRQAGIQADLEKKRIELLKVRADEMELEVKYMKDHPTAAWLKHLVNRHFKKKGVKQWK